MNRTHFVFIVIFLGILLLFGIVRSCTKDKGPSTFTSRVEQAAPKRDGVFFKKKEEEVFEEGKFERVPVPPTGTGSSESVQPERKVLTREEKILVTDTRGWMAKRGSIVANVNKLYAISKGAPIEMEEDERDLRTQYEAFRKETVELYIPPEHWEASDAVLEIDDIIREAIEMLSDPPTPEELDKAVRHLIGMTDQMNRLNLLLNEILY